jgi:branched-chain amino acid aminotransferase
MNPPDPGKTNEKVWIDGAPIDAALARVPVFDRGFLYGDSVYEVTRAFGGRPFALAEHLDRLERSAAGIGMSIPPRAEIEAAVAATCAAVGSGELYLRIIVTRGAGEIALDPGMADRPRLIVIARPVHPPPPSAYADGVNVALVAHSRSAPGTRAVDPSVKSGNYLVSVLAVAEAKRRDAFEAILCDQVGRLTEGSSSNLFVVRGGRIVTPPLSAGLLEGITRRHVIALAEAAGIAVDQVPLWPKDLETADEAFLTSSIRGVVPVVRVDGAPIGPAGDAARRGRPGQVTRQIMARYDELTTKAGAG